MHHTYKNVVRGWLTHASTNPEFKIIFVLYFSETRSRKRTSERGITPPDIMLRAVREVKMNNKSIRATAKDFEIPEATLRRFCERITEEEINGDAAITAKVRYYRNRQVYYILNYF